MAFKFCDTFCNITTSAQSPYATVSGTVTYSSAYARFSPLSGCIGGGVLISNNSSLRANLSAGSTSIIAFLSYGKNGTLNNGQRIISFWNSGTEVAGLVTTSAGAVQVTVAGSNVGSLSASGLILLSQSALVSGIEIQFLLGTSTGTGNVWINGTQVLNQTTLNMGTLSYNQIQIGDTTGGSAAMYTDFVRLWDNTGGTQNAPVGLDRQLITKLLSAAGTNTNMTLNGLASNYQCVSVIPPNTSDYVSTSTAGTADDYVLPVAGLTQPLTMVVCTSYYEKDDGATRTYTNGVLSSGSISTGSTFTANSAYTWVQNCILTDLATGLAWTALGADAAHFYHKEVS